MPLLKCKSKKCNNDKLFGNLYQQTRGSKFRKMQEIHLQELVKQTTNE
jgi:DNA replicative helicase MCM subunit Mcm2 (Cdc46/Mcm family)